MGDAGMYIAWEICLVGVTNSREEECALWQEQVMNHGGVCAKSEELLIDIKVRRVGKKEMLPKAVIWKMILKINRKGEAQLATKPRSESCL